MTQPSPHRAAIIGAGRIAGSLGCRDDVGREPPRSHAHGLLSAGFILDAVVEPAPSRRADFAGRWGIAHAVDHVAALSECGPLDLVVVCSPSSLHAPQVIEVLERIAPRLLIVEKPLCLSRAELDAMADAATRRSTRIVVNHSRRFDPGHQAARDLMASGRLGRPVAVRAVHYGGWALNGSHLIDTLSMLLRAPLRCVEARPGAPGRSPDDPCLNGRFSVDSHPGLVIAIDSVDERRFQLFEIEIHLTEGRLRCLDFGDRIMVEGVAVNALGERELTPAVVIERPAGTTAMAELYGRCAEWLSGRPADLDGAGLEAASATMRTLFDARRASSQGKGAAP
jgi:predicted dehydrogenase